MCAARPRVHGGIGGWHCAAEEGGVVAAELLVLVDDFAAVRGIVAAWQRGIVATWLRCCVAA